MFRGAKALPFAGLSSAAGLLLTAVALQAATPPDPAVEMRFPEGTNGWGGNGVITTNTGTLGGFATFYQPPVEVNPWETNLAPIFTTNVPVGTYVPAANEYSVDMGVVSGACASGNGGRGVDLTTDFPGFEDPPGYNPGSLGSLPKLTVCGWLNARAYSAYQDGNRIAYAMEGVGPGYQGFELVHGQQGELGLGINNGGSVGTRSSAKVLASSSLAANNWVFFAVTYDPTLSADQVKYYFGRADQLAYLDSAHTYASTNMDYSGPLTVGNYSTINTIDRDQTGGCSRLFRGLIDELRVYTNALTLDEIQQAQLNAPVPPTAASFIKQPVDVTSVAGANATFSCEASGSGLVTYQWRTNGVAVPGATKSTWTWSNVQQADNGTTVSVLIDNDVTVDPGIASSNVTLTVLPAEPKIVSMSFSANNGILTANSGAFGGTGRRKVVSGFPTIINTNVPSGSKTPNAAYNIDSLHMGPTAAHRAVDMTNNIVSPVGNLGNMSALTICGWLNSGNDTFRTTSTGRGCGIVNASLGGANGGFVLGYRSDNLGLPYGQNGRLQFHVNEWNTDGTTANLSSQGTIPLDTNLPPENWVFFAVTYDGTSSANNLSFYFGNKDQEATNDVTSTYNKGVIAKTGPLAMGNHNCTPGDPNTAMPGNPTGRNVSGNNGAMWRGLMDEIKIFSKVLTLEEIRAEQYAPSLPPYLKYATETNNLVLSWEGPFQLQDRASLDTGSWADNTTPTNVSGTIRSLGLPLSGDSKFFRLRE